MMLHELQVPRDRLERMKPGAAQMAPCWLLHNFILGVTVGHISYSDMEYCAYAAKAAASRKNIDRPRDDADSVSKESQRTIAADRV
jgi:hypothetical protein